MWSTPRSARSLRPRAPPPHITDAKDAFHSELYAAVKPQIASLYLKKWRENLSWATKTFTNEEEGGERRIRTRARPDTGPLPEPKLGE